NTRFKCDWSSDVCSSDLTLSSASLCVPLPLLLSPWRHTLSMAFSLCPSPPLPPSPSPPPSPWALWLTHTEFGFSLCPSATPTLPVAPHTAADSLFVSLSHSPLLSLYPSDRQVTCDPPGEAALWVKHTEFGFSLCPSLLLSPSPPLSLSPLPLSSSPPPPLLSLSPPLLLSSFPLLLSSPSLLSLYPPLPLPLSSLLSPLLLSLSSPPHPPPPLSPSPSSPLLLSSPLLSSAVMSSVAFLCLRAAWLHYLSILI